MVGTLYISNSVSLLLFTIYQPVSLLHLGDLILFYLEHLIANVKSTCKNIPTSIIYMYAIKQVFNSKRTLKFEQDWLNRLQQTYHFLSFLKIFCDRYYVQPVLFLVLRPISEFFTHMET